MDDRRRERASGVKEQETGFLVLKTGKGVNEMAVRKKRLSPGNRRGMYAIAAIVMVLLLGLLVQSQSLRAQNAEYAEQIADLEEQIQDEEVRADEIDELSEYLNSDEYVEKLAREKLGLVYGDEVIYRAAK
ncbi:MAG: septum formation initiator family protein [Clostridiales bacterium]|nr:septum formation initiator family protein [Clostridiales bacterium]